MSPRASPITVSSASSSPTDTARTCRFSSSSRAAPFLRPRPFALASSGRRSTSRASASTVSPASRAWRTPPNSKRPSISTSPPSASRWTRPSRTSTCPNPNSSGWTCSPARRSARWTGGRNFSKSGVYGDATIGTAEKGKKWFETSVEHFIKLVREFKQRERGQRTDYHKEPWDKHFQSLRDTGKPE